MGMTDRQFIAYRKKQLHEYERLFIQLKNIGTGTDRDMTDEISEAIKTVEVLINDAKSDIEV